MLRAQWAPYTLRFRETAITSRSRMTVKETYFIRVWDDADPTKVGYGECALFRGLSREDCPLADYENLLVRECRRLVEVGGLSNISSIRFGQEMAVNDLRNGGIRRFFDTPWSRGLESVQINGLVWMGDKQTMGRRIREKLNDGFHCVKLKIGGIDFDEEIDLLRYIRDLHPASEIELRLDANGAFTPENALERLNRLSEFNIHSLEQPIRQGQTEAMARICSDSPIPIALDEELIGVNSQVEKIAMLEAIRPSYIILKPSLCGGFDEADEWITEAEKRGIGWWATSALESDLGLGAIGQWVSRRSPSMPQGLGTGKLFLNNIPSPLCLSGERLSFNPEKCYEIPHMDWRDC